MKTKRVTVTALVDNDGEVESVESWLSEHSSELLHMSETGGCGCCVICWEIEAAESVLSTLPEHVMCGDGWPKNLN